MINEVPIVKMEAVSKVYPASPTPISVLTEINFQIASGECVAIVGPSGCGKSTLINLMGSLDTPTSGRIFFKDREISGLSPKELARLRNHEIGLVFQAHHLLPQCTVIENVLVPTLVYGADDTDRSQSLDRATALLERVGLSDRMHQLPGQLSGGERQRTAVVRALINRPSLLLADEPTGSLNEEGAQQLVDLLLELNRSEGMAMVIVTHATYIAERVGRIVALHNGHLAPQE